MTRPREVVLAWVDAFNRRDAGAAAALYHHDATSFQIALGEPVVGQPAIRDGLTKFFQAFPDSVTKVESLVEDGSMLALEWSGGGTWRGEFAGRVGNGRAFTLRGAGFFSIDAARIRWQRGYWDRAQWFDQLGLPITSTSPI
jgi:steroid delta-isomerase-like uncharacterized protein